MSRALHRPSSYSLLAAWRRQLAAHRRGSCNSRSITTVGSTRIVAYRALPAPAAVAAAPKSTTCPSHASLQRQYYAHNPLNAHGSKFFHTTSTASAGAGAGAGAGASSAGAAKRKLITVLSDDGRFRWRELSLREKAARTTQQSVNLLVILVGLAMTGGVLSVLYLDVFAPDSKTRQFNRAADRVKADARCIALLGDSKRIRAYGEPTANRWARNRPLASRVYKDAKDIEHMTMRFNVEGPLDKGVVSVHLVRPPRQRRQEQQQQPPDNGGSSSSSSSPSSAAAGAGYEYRLLALDVKGHARVVLERNARAGTFGDDDADGSGSSSKAKKKKTKGSEGDGDGVKMFGVRWR